MSSAPVILRIPVGTCACDLPCHAFRPAPTTAIRRARPPSARRPPCGRAHSSARSCSPRRPTSLLQATVGPAVPTFQQEFGAPTGELAWIMNGFILSSAVATPIAGRLGDVFGRKRVLVVVLVLLALGTAVCALATSLWVMVAGRVVAGLGGAVFPLSFAIVRECLARRPGRPGHRPAVRGRRGRRRHRHRRHRAHRRTPVVPLAVLAAADPGRGHPRRGGRVRAAVRSTRQVGTCRLVGRPAAGRHAREPAARPHQTPDLAPGRRRGTPRRVGAARRRLGVARRPHPRPADRPHHAAAAPRVDGQRRRGPRRDHRVHVDVPAAPTRRPTHGHRLRLRAGRERRRTADPAAVVHHPAGRRRRRTRLRHPRIPQRAGGRRAGQHRRPGRPRAAARRTVAGLRRQRRHRPRHRPAPDRPGRPSRARPCPRPTPRRPRAPTWWPATSA
ncbi:MFS transporter [Yinghuangia aomiensis]